jgi:threonylcarbamoyladenosine tRNA methylthiotransferase MtaB
MRTFFIENFGCRATQADGAALETLLEGRGMVSVPERSQAELLILNTCTVTAAADADVRASIRRSHKDYPESRILVTGCYAQRAPDALAAEPGVEWVVGNSHKAAIPELATAAAYHGGIHVGDIFAPHAMLTAPVVESLADRARPNLKIQDGCNNRCSFCVIPFVRGNSRFSSADEVVAQGRELSERYCEVVLTGINLGRWGREPGSRMRLADLVQLLIDRTPIRRIRLSSVEPMDWTDHLIELMASNPRIAPHAHLPLQSGSDRILRKMHRKYRPHHYAERVARISAAMPDAAIGADVMTGFPGETDQLFEESRAFIAGLPFTYLHVFTYSERPGTPAVSMLGSVPVPIRRERNRVLRALGEQKSREFRERMIGRTLPAVTLEERPYALTENYIRVKMADWRGANRMVSVRPVEVTATGMKEAEIFRMVGP